LTFGGRLGRAGLLTLVGLAIAIAPVAAAGTAGTVGALGDLTAAQQSLGSGQTGAAIRQLNSAAPAIPEAGTIASELSSGKKVLASRQLTLLLQAVSTRPGGPAPSTVQRAVSGVYRSPQLADLHTSTGGANSLLSQLANFLRQLAIFIFHAVGNTIWIALGLVVLVAGAALATVLLRRARGRLGLPTEESDEPAKGSPRLRPEKLFARAEQLRLEGRFGESVRAAFQALLLSASDRRVLDVDPSWTNSELLRAAAKVGELEPALRPLVAQFNHVVYGGEDPGPDGCSQFTLACRAAAAGLAQ
jgi:hypothetical protein